MRAAPPPFAVESPANYGAVSPKPGRGLDDELFDDQFLGGALHTAAYDVSPDGRFLMVKQGATSDQTSAAPQIVVVQNWFEELRRPPPGGCGEAPATS
ncbi:MAG: hypothetical protein HY655_00215 [Acidobacteria bacterium]|nr:hypothetical protein [Acidobacteriota bacterium]